MSKFHILFAEDNVVLNMATHDYLEDLGIGVESVYSGSTAIEAIDRHEYMTALLTDIDLGPGPDGFEVARHARRFHPHLPVVFVSGTMAIHHAANGVPGSAFVAKPFHPRQLMEALVKVIRIEAA
jgi:CheY-like chemotaxis protein